jgi:hypothetical protein
MGLHKQTLLNGKLNYFESFQILAAFIFDKEYPLSQLIHYTNDMIDIRTTTFTLTEISQYVSTLRYLSVRQLLESCLNNTDTDCRLKCVKLIKQMLNITHNYVTLPYHDTEVLTRNLLRGLTSSAQLYAPGVLKMLDILDSSLTKQVYHAHHTV